MMIDHFDHSVIDYVDYETKRTVHVSVTDKVVRFLPRVGDCVVFDEDDRTFDIDHPYVVKEVFHLIGYTQADKYLVMLEERECPNE